MPPEDGALLTFRVGDRRFALNAAEVAEVVRPPKLTRIPHAPAAVAGVVSLRGEATPVVALARLVGVEGAPGRDGRLVVLKGTNPLSLAVDEVTGLARGTAQAGGLVMTDAGETRVLSLDTLLQAQFAGFSRVGGKARITRAAPVAGKARSDDVALLGFLLAGQPYALPLEQVREVLSLPAQFAALPRTDEAMIGVTSLRGSLLPLVSTSNLLGLPAGELKASCRVVVAAIGEARVGLVVDQLTSILRAPAQAVGAVPSVLNRGAGEAHIDAMLRTSDGGLVSVLTPERLFREESVAQILEDGRQRRTEEMTAEHATSAIQRFLIFTLAEEAYGLPIAAVEEVVRLPERLTRLPKAPPFVLGVMNLRGEAVPVVEQRRRFGVEGQAPGRPRVIICRVGELTVGFAVDAVTEILEVPEDRLTETPELAAEAGRLFDQMAHLDDGTRVIPLVNPREMLQRAEADLLQEILGEDRPAS